jgi:hypothetical protein
VHLLLLLLLLLSLPLSLYACRCRASCKLLPNDGEQMSATAVYNSPLCCLSSRLQVKGKLEKDERWKLLPNDGERRLVFDEFCKNVAAEQKALAAAAEKQAVDGFK